MQKPRPHLTLPFAGSPLDRRDDVRRDEAAIEALAKGGRALFLPLFQGQVFVLHNGDMALLQEAALAHLTVADPGPVFLGTMGETAQPWFALALDDDAGFPLEGLGDWQGLRLAAARLPAPDLAIAGRASALLGWHARHRFCPNCGAPSTPGEGGAKRLCSACGSEHFARTDPVVIMLAVRGGQCLLGRQSGWPAGVYSALAGFVEPGESLEEACAREITEETSVRTGAVRYVLSQPWPFPSSLMIGLIAQAQSEAITLDDELEDARWFARDDVRTMLDGSHAQYSAPMAFSAAHHLMRAWVQGDA